MKIRQNVRHFATRKALEAPLLGDRIHDWLVDLHTDVFLERADPADREERRAHLDAFFDAAVDMYLRALQEGFDEASAREITHVVANFDFYDHGWTEMMEFPVAEVDDHYERHADFFSRHGVEFDRPLGEFTPAGGLPEAPATPEKLDAPDQPHAEGGYADDVYVEDEAGEVRAGGREEPEDVDATDAPGTPEDA